MLRKPFLAGLSFLTALTANALPLDQISLPPNFKISVYATVPNARSMTLADNGIVFVGTRTNNKVYALLPTADFSQASKVITVADKLKTPNGVAYFKGDLFVAEPSRILRYANILKNLINPVAPQVIINNLPSNPNHGWRYIGVGPDGWLYIAIGAPCNICVENDARFASIDRMKLDGSGFQIFAHGIRNSVGFDWNPITKKMWFTENGRDWLGNNLPPDEVNVATKANLNFGFPYYFGDNQPDPTFSARPPVSEMTPALYNLPAHVAALGLRFYNGAQFPKQYKNSIFIAEHGSWNRTSKVGYQVINLQINKNKVVNETVFASGWLQGQRNWGRPVDVLVLPDGSLLVSDDYSGTVYRISYQV